MLKDRKVLVENEIEKLKRECGQEYLSMIRGVNIIGYDDKREKLTSLMVDLSLIEKMISDGQE